VANIAIAVLFLALGPVMIGIGTHLSSADAELVRTGERATGTIVDFNDVRKASSRDIDVEFQSADGRFHSVDVPVDHDQHPVVGEEVTVVYRESNPDDATVLGFESDGDFLTGAGGIVTLIFWAIAIPLTIKSLVRARKRRKYRIG
jgi:cytochrome c oxidase assembly protein Cox11